MLFLHGCNKKMRNIDMMVLLPKILAYCNLSCYLMIVFDNFFRHYQAKYTASYFYETLPVPSSFNVITKIFHVFLMCATTRKIKNYL